MPRSAYMDEAAYLAAAVPQNRCPSTDALDVLDVSPHIRLALEDTWTLHGPDLPLPTQEGETGRGVRSHIATSR